jgi:hypothetical protein
MYDMKPLEVEWKKYKVKQRRPIYMVVLVIILLFGVGLLDYNKTISKLKTISYKFDFNKKDNSQKSKKEK